MNFDPVWSTLHVYQGLLELKRSPSKFSLGLCKRVSWRERETGDAVQACSSAGRRNGTEKDAQCNECTCVSSSRTAQQGRRRFRHCLLSLFTPLWLAVQGGHEWSFHQTVFPAESGNHEQVRAVFIAATRGLVAYKAEQLYYYFTQHQSE